MSTTISSICPLCRKPEVSVQELHYEQRYDSVGRLMVPPDPDTGRLVSCSTCGDFIVTQADRSYFLDDSARRSQARPAELSALVRESHIQSRSPLWLRFIDENRYWPLVLPDGFNRPVDCIPIQAKELLTRWPKNVAEKLNRTLINLARMSQHPGQRIALSTDDVSVAFSANWEEMRFFLESLQGTGLLEECAIPSGGASIRLSAEGWGRCDALTSGPGSPASPVFVAMWFGGTDADDQAMMRNLYEQGIAPAVQQAGYCATRVDLEEHNDFIMDKVLGDIRVAPFMIADFTGNRGGVYLEAGYARGLGKQVIHTCRSSDFSDAHFDIKQINTIKWEHPEELKEKLYHRIRGTIGTGPLSFQVRS